MSSPIAGKDPSASPSPAGAGSSTGEHPVTGKRNFSSPGFHAKSVIIPTSGQLPSTARSFLSISISTGAGSSAGKPLAAEPVAVGLFPTTGGYHLHVPPASPAGNFSTGISTSGYPLELRQQLPQSAYKTCFYGKKRRRGEEEEKKKEKKKAWVRL